MTQQPHPFHCSFCGKSNTETELMLAGPVSVFICAECVSDAYRQVNETIAQRRADKRRNDDVQRCAFCIPFPLTLMGGKS